MKIHSPFVLVLFGATGDLAKHKLLPALFSLHKKKELPESFYIYGFARRPFSDDEYRQYIKDEIGKEDKDGWEDFANHLHYQQGNFDEKEGYLHLATKLQNLDEEMKACTTRIFYLATPPENYDSIIDHLVETELSEGRGQGSSKWTRIALEKPFGKDLVTARALDKKLGNVFEEKQIFRVDHYLGKETLQNLLIFRFANGIFDPIWTKEYIDHVQITFAEQKGIAGRGKFFDGVGMLRDVAQNHIMQMIAAVAMEMPHTFSEEGVRDARAKAIQVIENIEPNQVNERVVRGQYEGYREEKDVNPDSITETFVAMKLFINSRRFLGVPFYIRVGKELAESVAEINLVFKQTCHILFKEIGCPEEGNVLTIRIQPNEGITIKMIAKTPGSTLALEPVNMHFRYQEEFGTSGADAYERILKDIIRGDQMLFARSDELEASWIFIQKILQGWEEQKAPLVWYPKGSWGPHEADMLIEKDGKKWVR